MTCLADDLVLGLVEGRLAPPVLATVDEHLDACAACRAVVTQVARAQVPVRRLVRGDTVGRYVIGEHLGSGAMGHVYSAWQPELDRRVALKLLAATDAGARERVAREAKAMARLDHPNVVGVHEVGTAGEATYVAMELVEGETLRAWASARTWREIAAVLAEVARGLAAVHAAGVVHRDVKPDNVIVGHDGRARLGDFGLARAHLAPARGDARDDEGAARAASDARAFALGTPTAIAGTPAYMAPEVAAGGAASAAADQFSFGVTAYEMLAGRRPFVATTFAQLRAAYAATRPAPLREVPAWLDAAIRRCLAIDPAARFASLADVAAALAVGLARRRSPAVWLGIAAAAVLASGVTYALARDDGIAAPACAAGAPEIAVVWSPAARAQLAAIGAPALHALDGWTAAWAAERDATCRARASEPPAQLVARDRCLARRRDELAALVAQLAPVNGAPRPGVARADVLAALATLPLPAECARADAADPVPLDPARAALVAGADARLAALQAALALGDARPVVAATPALVDSARASGHAPTLAAALLLHAEALRATGALARAAEAARDAVAEAERGHADLLAARAWLARVAIAGDQRDLTAATDLAVIAAGTLDRAGAPERLGVALARLRGLVAYNRGALAEARTLLSDAHARLATGADDADPGRALERIAIESALGSVARAAGDLDAAEAWHQRAYAADRALRGEAHPDVARDLHNLAGIARLRGDLALATARYTEALRIEIATRGEHSVEAGITHNSLGLIALARGALAEARAQFTLARDALTAAGHGDRAFAEHNLGLVDAAEGKPAAALAHYAVAADIYARTIGADAAAVQRLADDRAAAQRALRPRPSPRAPQPVVSTKVPDVIAPAVPDPPRKRDVGVYGSGQSWSPLP